MTSENETTALCKKKLKNWLENCADSRVKIPHKQVYSLEQGQFLCLEFLFPFIKTALQWNFYLAHHLNFFKA